MVARMGREPRFPPRNAKIKYVKGAIKGKSRVRGATGNKKQ